MTLESTISFHPFFGQETLLYQTDWYSRTFIQPTKSSFKLLCHLLRSLSSGAYQPIIVNSAAGLALQVDGQIAFDISTWNNI